MKNKRSRSRTRLNPITDRLRASNAANDDKLPSAILFAAIVGVFPLAYGLQWLTGAGWLGSVLGAVAIAAIAAFGAFTMIRG